MPVNRHSIVLFLIAASLTGAGWAASPADAEDRIQWFRQDKFGMFIHWGPYSLLAGEWKGQRVPVGTEAEWIMQRFNIPVKEYRDCLLYTSDAADDLLCVDLGGRRIIKKKKT